MHLRRARVQLAAVVAVAVVSLVSCSSSDGATGRAKDSTTTATIPAPRPEGVLVPGGSIVLGANDATVESSFDGRAFHLTTTVADQSVTFVSTVGTYVGAGGMPLRCGDGARRGTEPTLDGSTEVTGASAHLSVGSGDGTVSITTVSPPTLATHPEGVGRLPRAELASSVLLDPAQAQQLADQPADDPLIVQRWTHEFDGGLVVQGELGGALARELFYRFVFSGTGQGRVATSLNGIPCNGRGAPGSYTDEATYGLVLLAGGTTLRVDGEAVTDTIADPALQGEWAVTEVTKEAGTAKAEVLDPAGRRIDHWTLTYTDPADVD